MCAVGRFGDEVIEQVAFFSGLKARGNHITPSLSFEDVFMDDWDWFVPETLKI